MWEHDLGCGICYFMFLYFMYMFVICKIMALPNGHCHNEGLITTYCSLENLAIDPLLGGVVSVPHLEC